MTMHVPSRFLRTLLLGIILSACGLLHADEVMDRLVRLVGSDAGLCVEVPRLDETLTAFEQGEFFQRLQHSRIYARWKTSGEYRRVAEIAGVVEKHTGKPARQFVREIFGTAVVVAAYSEPGPKMSAILMSEAMSREALEAAITAWNHLEPSHIEAIPSGGRTYYKRFCAAKPGHPASTLYYATLDRTLLLSDREELVRRALTLADQSGQEGSLLALPAFQQARRSLTSACAARAYVNPRAFDAMLGVSAGETESSAITSKAQAIDSKTVAQGEAAKFPHSPTCRTIQAAWRRCEWLAIDVQTDRGIVLEAIARYRTAGLSAEARQLIGAMSGAPELLRLAPPDAFVILACRQPFGNLLRRVLVGQAKAQPSPDWESIRQVSRGLLLGLDPIDEVLPSFRENFGGYMVPRQGAKPEELPLDGLLAAELPGVESPGHASGRASTSRTAPPGPQEAIALGETARADSIASRLPPSVRDAIDNGLNMGFNFAAAYFNTRATGTPAVVRSDPKPGRGTRIRWIEGFGPYQPAYGLTSRYLVLATSPQAVRNFAASEAGEHGRSKEQAAGMRIPPAIEELAKRYFPTENQILFVDTAAIRRFLQAHGPQLVQHAIRVGSIPPAHAEKALAKFLDVTGLFDTLFAAGRLDEGSVRLVIGGIVNGPAAPETAATR